MNLSSKVILHHETTESLDSYNKTNCQMKFKASEDSGLMQEAHFLSEMSDSNLEDTDYDIDKVQTSENERETNHE